MVEKCIKTGLDVSTCNYIKAATTLALIAENITHIPIPNKTLSVWERMIYAIRIGDDRLDNITNDIQRTNFKESVMGFLRNKPVFLADSDLNKSMVQLRDISNSLPERKRDHLLSTFDNLLVITEKLRHTQDRKYFSFLTRLEGQLTSRLFLIVLPDEYRDSSKYKDLVKTVTRLARFGNVVDDFSDLPDDYREGTVKINPTITTRMKLLFSSIPDVAEAFKHVRLNKSLAEQIIKRTKETLENNTRYKNKWIPDQPAQR